MSALSLPVMADFLLPAKSAICLDWSPDGSRLAVADAEGGVVVLGREGNTLWSQSKLMKKVWDVKWSPDGRSIAVSGDHRRGILSAQLGAFIWDKEARNGRSVDFDSAGRHLFSAAHGSQDVAVELAVSGDQIASWPGGKCARALAVSPDDQIVAVSRNLTGNTTTIELIDRLSGRSLHQQDFLTGWVFGFRWAPAGDRVACAIGNHRMAQQCFTLDRRRFELAQTFGFSGKGIWSLDWTKEGNLIAIGSFEGGVAEVFRDQDGKLLARCSLSNRGSSRHHTPVAFSPDGRRLAIGCGSRIQVLGTSRIYRQALGPSGAASLQEYAAKQAVTVGRRPADLAKQAGEPPGSPALWDRLLISLAALHGLDLTPPLSLLVQLDELLVGRVSEAVPEDLRAHPGIGRLRGLRWPPESRAGLIALLLRKLPLDGWQPPAGTGSRDLRAVLGEALGGDRVAPRPEPFPGVLLRQAADVVDSRLITLLEILGPEAVRDDPGLALRLLALVSALPPFARGSRHVLSENVMSDEDGRAQRLTAGGGLSGIRRRGRPEALLPSQLALPPEVLALRHLRGDLLYRAHSGGEPPRFRPTVIVLDVSPPTFGPVEKVTRTAAMLVGRSLLEAGLPAILVTAGGRSRFHVLDSRSRLLCCWTERSLEPVRLSEALRTAEALRETLRGGPLEPVVLLLSHAGFAEQSDRTSPLSPRALLVRYPGQRAKVTREHRWSRLAMVDAGAAERLPGILRELIS